MDSKLLHVFIPFWCNSIPRQAPPGFRMSYASVSMKRSTAETDLAETDLEKMLERRRKKLAVEEKDAEAAKAAAVLAAAEPSKRRTYLPLKMVQQLLALRPHQEDHVRKLAGVLRHSYVAADFSPTGTGKTFAALNVAAALGWKTVLVVCPPSVTYEWKRMEERGREFGKFEVQHWVTLRKHDEEDHTVGLGLLVFKKAECCYTVQEDKLRKLIRTDGVLLVVDEMQHAKNDNSQRRALWALCQTFRKLRTANPAMGCGVLLASATPFDRMEHRGNFMNMLFADMPNMPGRNKEDRCAKPILCVAPGVQDEPWPSPYVTELARKFRSPALEAANTGKNPASSLVGPLLDCISSSMVRPVLTSTHIRLIATFNIRGRLAPSPPTFETYTHWRKEVEAGKLDLVVELIEQALKESDNIKVIFMSTFVETTLKPLYAKCLEKRFAMAGGIVSGEMPDHKRTRAFQAFQRADSRARVLLGTLPTMGTGINLHDTDGRFPRLLLVFPGFESIGMSQATGRVNREGGLSNSVTVFVCGRYPDTDVSEAKGDPIAASFLQQPDMVYTTNLSKKSRVIAHTIIPEKVRAQMMSEMTDQTVNFLHLYPRYIDVDAPASFDPETREGGDIYVKIFRWMKYLPPRADKEEEDEEGNMDLRRDMVRLRQAAGIADDNIAELNRDPLNSLLVQPVQADGIVAALADAEVLPGNPPPPHEARAPPPRKAPVVSGATTTARPGKPRVTGAPTASTSSVTAVGSSFPTFTAASVGARPPFPGMVKSSSRPAFASATRVAMTWHSVFPGQPR